MNAKAGNIDGLIPSLNRIEVMRSGLDCQRSHDHGRHRLEDILFHLHRTEENNCD